MGGSSRERRGVRQSSGAFSWRSSDARSSVALLRYVRFHSKAAEDCRSPRPGGGLKGLLADGQIFFYGGYAAGADCGVLGVGTNIGFPMPATLAFLAVSFGN